jgi:hypothetical protein
MVTYDSEGFYIASKRSAREKVIAIDAIIDALLLQAANEATSEGVTSYSLNDGQVQIATTRRGAESIMKSIQAFEKLRTYYEIRANGSRMTRLVDSKNFIGRHNGRFR